MKRVICLNLAGLVVSGIMSLTSWAAVNPSILGQFEHPDRDRVALQKLRDALWPEAQEANPIALKIVENALRALDQDREDDELPFKMPKKLSDAAVKGWQAQVRKKAEAGDMFFACVLGSMYLEGSGIEKDESKGQAWLEKAAEAQSALAHSWLGYAYTKGLGGSLYYSKAIKHYLQAGELGLAAGWNNAGWHQSEYHFMSSEFPSPRECYEKAMALNYPRACYNLGLSYMKGKDGVVLDKNQGLSLIRQAAKKNYHQAQQFLADGYLSHNRGYGDMVIGWALLQPPPGKPGKNQTLKDAFQRSQIDTIKLWLERERGPIFYIGDEENTTVMHAAVGYNRLDILHMVLQKGGDLNIRNDFGYTPLQLAILLNNTSNRKPIIEYLVEQGARLDASAAALSDNPAMLQEVLEADPDEVNSRDERGMTPLHLAALHRQLKNAELLLNFGANPDARNIFDETPLHTVIYTKNAFFINYDSMRHRKPDETILAIIDLLLAYGADINAKDKVHQREPRAQSGTPLMAALAVRYIPAAKLLVERGAEVNVRSTSGLPAISQAAAHAPDIALTMIERGVDVHYRLDDGWTILHSAVYSENERLIETLLSHGVDINAKSQSGETALDYAVRIGKLPAIIAAYQKHGVTVPEAILSAPPLENPLLWCFASFTCKGKHYDSEKALIESIEGGMTNYQQLINIPNRDGSKANKTLPLEGAVSYNRYEIAKWLIEKGADVNARSPEGSTALFNAVKRSKLHMVKLLLKNKADPNAKVEGVSPLQEAHKKGHTEIIKLLLAYGASE